MRKELFIFDNTCRVIDRGIGDCTGILVDNLVDCILEICPILPIEKADEIAKTWSKKMYNSISESFESVRETNVNMRDAANEQIRDLTDELENAKRQIGVLDYDLDNAKGQIKILKYTTI